MKIRDILIVFLAIVSPFQLSGQIEKYRYRREILSISDSWHKIPIPLELFQRAQPNLNDLRIIGFTEKQDTIEAPYVINEHTNKIITQKIPFSIINQVRKGNTSYYTFVPKGISAINQILLNLSKENYELLVQLEGSNNNVTWYSILRNYRIVGINNSLVSYNFSELVFPEAQYKYFRVSWKNNKRVYLNGASLKIEKIERGLIANYPCTFESENNKNTKRTTVDLKLEKPVPISGIKITLKDKFDFYRPLTIKRVVDSIKTPDGWHVNYAVISHGVVSSLEEPAFTFSKLVTNRIKLVIDNQDNTPLSIQNIEVFGNKVSLSARFVEEAKYYLYYGNLNAIKPKYDIEYFNNSIRGDIKQVKLSDEEKFVSNKPGGNTRNEIKRYWLWIVMGIIVIVLGGFTISMIKNSNNG